MLRSRRIITSVVALAVCAVAGTASGALVELTWPTGQAQCVVLLAGMVGLVLGGMSVHYWTLTEPKYKQVAVVEEDNLPTASATVLALEDYTNDELVLEEDAV